MTNDRGMARKETAVKGTMRRLGVAVLVIGVMAMLAGCEIQRANYEMVKLGMNKEAVRAIMKEPPTEETADTILYIPGPDQDPLRVEFEFDQDGKLVKKEWVDRENL